MTDSRPRARRLAEDLERDAAKYPEQRAEILIEAAREWSQAGEPDRALRIYEDIIASERGEDAQFATVEKISLLADLGRTDEAEAEIARLGRTRVHPGPAELVAEFLEAQGRLEEALTWFNTACRDLMADDGELAEAKLFARPELRGRQRVRQALGLPPDAIDLHTEDEQAELTELLEKAAAPSQPNAGSFFVRSDVERAFAEGLVHGTAPADASSYFRDVERGWRTSSDEIGASVLRVLPTMVDDLLKYADDHDRDPRDQQTRADHLMTRIREGAPTLGWPPERNAPCWCGSGRKYKKCCGSPTNR
ncbi:SEC-C domain-containing protein [Actinomadura latina]|uniref:SEC-C domain-containing protein n=1 Tax=Actinomadura latina TaxID=163603 RepID=A0A846YW94_9ACTN|nr:SEC-C domain-containing protein [Actinomadura latina]NKZ02952.1 SEC-C domain-containing protein [Actinomadura latina]